MNTHFLMGLLCFAFVMYVSARPEEDQVAAVAASAAGVVEKDIDSVVGQVEKTGDSILHAGGDLLKNNPLRGLLGNLFHSGAVAAAKS